MRVARYDGPLACEPRQPIHQASVYSFFEEALRLLERRGRRDTHKVEADTPRVSHDLGFETQAVHR